MVTWSLISQQCSFSQVYYGAGQHCCLTTLHYETRNGLQTAELGGGGGGPQGKKTGGGSRGGKEGGGGGGGGGIPRGTKQSMYPRG